MSAPEGNQTTDARAEVHDHSRRKHASATIAARRCLPRTIDVRLTESMEYRRGEGRAHSGLMPANFTTFAHLSVSVAINLPKSSGEPANGSTPPRQRCRIGQISAPRALARSVLPSSDLPWLRQPRDGTLRTHVVFRGLIVCASFTMPVWPNRHILFGTIFHRYKHEVPLSKAFSACESSWGPLGVRLLR
jgi:hypothetical protein